MDRLRGQTHMAHDRHPHLDDRLDGLVQRDSPFQFDGLCSTLLQQPTRVALCLLHTDLEREKGHIGNDQGPLATADHCLGVVDHLV